MTPYSRAARRVRRSAVVRKLAAFPWVRWLAHRPLGLRLRQTLAPRAPAADPGLSAGSRAVTHSIERYSAFQGSLHIVGWLESPQAAIEAVTLCLGDGGRIPVEFWRPGLPGLASMGVRGMGRRVAFDVRLAVPADAAEVAEAWLLVTLSDASHVRVGQLGAPEGDAAHALSSQFQALLRARAPGRLLEVGARARSGHVRRGLAPAGWHYSGFDIMAGPNVDVVGDAHELSRHYAPGGFDAVMAFSVLEHLMMPWKFVLELNAVLKVGGIGLFTTHQCWPLHDEPWDFWRFSDRAWTALLNPATGFEIIEARMGEPAFVVAQRCHPATAFAETPAGALASFVLFRKVGPTALQWPVELGAVTATRYPSDITGAPR